MDLSFRRSMRMVPLLLARTTGLLGLSLLAVCLAHSDSSAEAPSLAVPLSEPSATINSTLSSTISSTLSSTLSSTIGSTLTQTVKIAGSLLERGTKRPLSQVNIYCFPASFPDTPVKGITDATGKFAIDVPEGRMKWVISVSGYNRFELEDEQHAGALIRPRIFYLEKKTYLAYETTVYGEMEKRDDKTRSLDQAQFATVPGANGDPVKAVQNLPGVNRPGAFSSQVIIEGSPPYDTRYNIDNQSVPIIFHFGGLSSVVIPAAIDHVDYLSAGFGPEFGQTTAGLVNLAIKDPQTDRDHGFVFVDLANAGGMVEGPIDDHSSYLAGIRQSYIGYVFREAIRHSSGDTNKNFELTAVPEFRDMVVKYKNTVSPDDTFRIVGVGSQDTFAFLLKQPADEDPSIRGRFSLNTKFFRIIPEWTHQFTPNVIGRYSLGMGKDWVLFDMGDLYYHFDESVLTGRGEIEDQVNTAWKSYMGIDFQSYWATQSYQFPVVYSQGGISSTLGAGDVQTVSKKYDTTTAGLYWRNVIALPGSRWTFIPGARLSYFNQTKEDILEPRAAIRYALDRGWTLRAAAGLYNQAPPVNSLDETYGNPKLKSERATHYTLGFEKDFRDGAATGWSISNDFFYKRLYNLVAGSTAFVSPSRPEYFNNSGYGHSNGLEFLGKYKTPSWQGWVSYTYSRSTRGNAQTPERLSQYDQTHLLTIVGDRELGRNWKLSVRVRYTSGNLYTPITGGVFDIDNDVYTPIRGPIYSKRMRPFFQADARFDKKWVYDRRILTAYLDIQNVTNQENPEEITYSYDYRRSAMVTGLPIIPILGVKVEF